MKSKNSETRLTAASVIRSLLFRPPDENRHMCCCKKKTSLIRFFFLAYWWQVRRPYSLWNLRKYSWMKNQRLMSNKIIYQSFYLSLYNVTNNKINVALKKVRLYSKVSKGTTQGTEELFLILIVDCSQMLQLILLIVFVFHSVKSSMQTVIRSAYKPSHPCRSFKNLTCYPFLAWLVWLWHCLSYLSGWLVLCRTLMNSPKLLSVKKDPVWILKRNVPFGSEPLSDLWVLRTSLLALTKDLA